MWKFFSILSYQHTPCTINRRASQSGFTLVELAVILTIMGLIIGAVTIGKDIQRNTEHTKIKNKFIDQWEQAHNQHYQRTGLVLGDGQISPRITINGNVYDIKTGNPISGADVATLVPVDAEPVVTCARDPEPDVMRTDTPFSALKNNLRQNMMRAGIHMPPDRAEGQEDRYAYANTNGAPQKTQTCF
jgi:type II secretory pathway pseudopilin PulG